ncbi:MAG TPA: PAS domain-containing protein, partial [Ktedonobacteraceae bacterium]|nr:PAS domain-containing protein [Ktedonobacteraceae bacterium]
MKSEESARLAYTLDHLTVGAAILDGTSLRILYANASILSFLSEPWLSEGIIGHTLAEVASPELLPTLQFQLGKAYLSGERQTFSDVPYEGFLGTRGRTYWHITIEPLPKFQMPQTPQTTSKRGKPKMALLVTVEDVTAQVRSRLQLKAIHYITSVITDPYALPQVLDRILQTVQEMIGSTRCAILLQDRTSASRTGEQLANARVNSIQVAAHKGLHASARTWRPLISSNVLYKRVSQMNQTLIISDTSQEPDLQLPMVNDDGEPARPLSVLSVPIFEPTSQYEMEEDFYLTPDTHLHTREVVGTIEVYHRKVRSFAAEEVELLEQFSLQAGIAIRNTRIFRSIDQLAARASRNARQREKVLQAIPDGVIIYDARWRIIDVNDAIRKVMGWTNDVIGKHVSTAFKQSKAIMPALASISSEDLAREYEQRALEQQINEIKLIGADGQPYTMRRSQAAIRDELGDVFAFVAVYHDVTEQAKARERIEEEVTNRTAELAQRNKALQRAKRDLELESARMQLLLERLPSGVMLISSYDSRISMINHQAVQLLQDMGILLEPQHDLAEATRNAHGKNIESLLRSITMYRSSASPFPYEEQPLYQALTEGKAGEAEFFVIGPFQQPLFVLANAAPLRASDGTITNVVLLCHNITRMKLLEQTREDFFTAMAHELKTPLANIRAHLSALQIRDIQPSPEEQTLFINTADEQAERLVRMINQFLDASRVEAG